MRSQGPASITRVKRKSSVGQVVMTMLSVLVLFLSAFTAISVPVSSQRNLAAFLQNRVDAAVLALPEQAEAKVDYEFTIDRLIRTGAPDRATAIRWLHDAHGTDGDNEYLCFQWGLPYGYLREAA